MSEIHLPVCGICHFAVFPTPTSAEKQGSSACISADKLLEFLEDLDLEEPPIFAIDLIDLFSTRRLLMVSCGKGTMFLAFLRCASNAWWHPSKDLAGLE